MKYASADVRPVRLLMDGKVVGEVCGVETGGFGLSALKWQPSSAFVLDLSQPHLLRLETDGYFPHVAELALVPSAAPNKAAYTAMEQVVQ